MWTNTHLAGLLPAIIFSDSTDTAQVQLEKRYAHGGGYTPFGDGDWELRNAEGAATLHYPEDPPFAEVARCGLPNTGETCILFDYDFVAIVQADGTFVVTRVD